MENKYRIFDQILGFGIFLDGIFGDFFFRVRYDYAHMLIVVAFLVVNFFVFWS